YSLDYAKEYRVQEIHRVILSPGIGLMDSRPYANDIIHGQGWVKNTAINPLLLNDTGSRAAVATVGEQSKGKGKAARSIGWLAALQVSADRAGRNAPEAEVLGS